MFSMQQDVCFISCLDLTAATRVQVRPATLSCVSSPLSLIRFAIISLSCPISLAMKRPNKTKHINLHCSIVRLKMKCTEGCVFSHCSKHSYTVEKTLNMLLYAYIQPLQQLTQDCSLMSTTTAVDIP